MTCQHPDGCDRPVKARGWCRAHNDRITRTGNAGVAAIQTRHDAGSRTCKREDCDRVVTADAGHGWCGMHYQRWATHGDPDIVKTGGSRKGQLAGARNPNWTGTDATYQASHLRVRATCGPASKYDCIDCGQQAAHWSYNNADPDERREDGLGRYSTRPVFYDPRCVKCHSKFDRAARGALITGSRPSS